MALLFKLPCSVILNIIGSSFLCPTLIPFSSILLLMIKNGLNGKEHPSLYQCIKVSILSLFIYVLIKLTGPVILDLICQVIFKISCSMPYGLFQMSSNFAKFIPDNLINLVSYIFAVYFSHATIWVDNILIMKCNQGGSGSQGENGNSGSNSGVATNSTVGNYADNYYAYEINAHFAFINNYYWLQGGNKKNER